MKHYFYTCSTLWKYKINLFLMYVFDVYFLYTLRKKLNIITIFRYMINILNTKMIIFSKYMFRCLICAIHIVHFSYTTETLFYISLTFFKYMIDLFWNTCLWTLLFEYVLKSFEIHLETFILKATSFLKIAATFF